MNKRINNPKFKLWLMKELRKIYMKDPERKSVLRDSRVSRGKYQCAHCKEIFRPKEVFVDHINPVISITDGFVDWNVYINRLFVEKYGLQVLCKNCHDHKTHKEENPERRKNKTNGINN